MGKTIWSVLRTVGLIGLIVFDAALIATMFIAREYYWAFFFISITAAVGIFEGLAYLTTGKTISTQYKDFFKKNALLAAMGLIFFGLAMASLILHLSVW
jgi:hypothetical protein